MIFHLTSTAHYIASGGIKDTVTCAACNVHCFQNVDVGAGHLTVSYKEARCCERSQSAAYQICIFVVNAFRFFGTGECFVVTVGVVNALAVFLIFAPLCVAIARVRSRHFDGFFCGLCDCFFNLTGQGLTFRCKTVCMFFCCKCRCADACCEDSCF